MKNYFLSDIQVRNSVHFILYNVIKFNIISEITTIESYSRFNFYYSLTQGQIQ